MKEVGTMVSAEGCRDRGISVGRCTRAKGPTRKMQSSGAATVGVPRYFHEEVYRFPRVKRGYLGILKVRAESA